MAGGHPLNRLFFLFALLIGCCGYLPVVGSAQAEQSDETGKEQAELIPQDDIILHKGEGEKKKPVTYSLTISKNSERLDLDGYMSSEEDYKTLIGLVKANFPATNLNDDVEIKKEKTEEDVKIGGFSFALKLLGYVETGRASVDNNGLSLRGKANTAVVLTEINKLIESEKPTGIPITLHIARPDKNWQASISGDRLVKISGLIKSRELKDTIFSVVQRRFSDSRIEDRTFIKKDVSEEWAKVSLKSIELLALLEKGSVEITEKTVHLKGDASSSRALYEIDRLSRQLPDGFSLKSEVTAPMLPRAGMVAVPVLGAISQQ